MTAAEIAASGTKPATPSLLAWLERWARRFGRTCFGRRIYNLLAIPIAAGTLYPSLGVLLRPEWAALLMSASTILVTFNALALNLLKTDSTRSD